MIELGIIGTGGKANDHVRRFQKIRGVRLVACCDIQEERAKAFAATDGIPRWYTDHLRMLDDGGLDAVSVVTVDAAHALVSLAAAWVASGAIGRVVHVEASHLQSWLTQDAWGDWRTKDAFTWRLSTRHGSAGVLGDIGCHIYDLATLIAGDIVTLACDLKTFGKGVGRASGSAIRWLPGR